MQHVQRRGQVVGVGPAPGLAAAPKHSPGLGVSLEVLHSQLLDEGAAVALEAAPPATAARGTAIARAAAAKGGRRRLLQQLRQTHALQVAQALHPSRAAETERQHQDGHIDLNRVRGGGRPGDSHPSCPTGLQRRSN